MKILLIVFLVLAAGTAGLGWIMAGYSMSIRPQTLSQARAWQEEHYDFSWYDGLEKQDYTVESFDGYVLHTQRLVNPSGAGRTVIISHGYTDNRFGALKYARIYLDRGFHVIVYDLRGHGENVPTFCTYSVRESRDLDVLIRDAKERFPDTEILGLHGESLGAATSLAALRYAPGVDFVAADCGFADIAEVLRGGMRSMHLPGFPVNAASLFAKLRFGYSYREMRPIDALRENRVPILFLHGAEDGFIPPRHSEEMRAATAGYSELYLIPGAGHAVSVLTEPEEYREHVNGFLDRLGIGSPA